MGRYSGTLERDDSALRRALRVTVSRQTESADRHCSWIKRRFYHPMVLGQLPNAQKPTCRLPRRAQKLRSPDNTPAGSGTPSGSALPWHGLATTRSRSPVIARRGRLWRSECRSLTCSQVCDHNVPHAPLITPRATRSSMTHAWDLTSVRRTRSKHDKHAQKREDHAQER